MTNTGSFFFVYQKWGSNMKNIWLLFYSFLHLKFRFQLEVWTSREFRARIKSRGINYMSHNKSLNFSFLENSGFRIKNIRVSWLDPSDQPGRVWKYWSRPVQVSCKPLYWWCRVSFKSTLLPTKMHLRSRAPVYIKKKKKNKSSASTACLTMLRACN